MSATDRLEWGVHRHNVASHGNSTVNNEISRRLLKESLMCQIIQASISSSLKWDANKNQLTFRHYKEDEWNARKQSDINDFAHWH